MSEKKAIEIRNLGKMYKIYNRSRDKFLDIMGFNFFHKDYYKEFWALRGIDLVIHKGEKVGLIGRNGAGKSTLLKCIIGNIHPTEGDIAVHGKVQALMELGTGFHPEFTGRENIRASLAYNNLKNDEILKREQDIIDFSELEEFIDQPIKTYSNGMLARLGFATATAIKPEILIIDEVLGAGDAYFAGKCIERMRKLTDDFGVTVLFVSHDLGSLQMLCDRSVWIHRGKVVQDGETLEIIKNYSEEIRRTAEIRQQAKNKKLLQHRQGSIDTFQDVFESHLFRFCVEQSCDNRIRRILVKHGKEVLLQIPVGETMDNNSDYEGFIVDNIDHTAWAASRKDANGYYRSCNAIGSFPGGAAFQCNLPQGENNDCTIEILADIPEGAEVTLEKYNEAEKVYEKLGCLLSGSQDSIFKLESPAPSVIKAIGQINEKRDIRETDQCQIVQAKILDAAGIAKTVFAYESGPQQFKFQIKLTSAKPQLQLVFLIFSDLGMVEYSNAVEVENKLGQRLLDIVFNLDEVKIGPGEYTISFGVYDGLVIGDNSREQPYLAMLDRTVSFKILEPLSYKLVVGKIVPINMPSIVGGEGNRLKCHSLI